MPRLSTASRRPAARQSRQHPLDRAVALAGELEDEQLLRKRERRK